MARQESASPGRARVFWYVVASGWAWLWSLWTLVVLAMAVPEWLGLTPASAEDIEGGIVVAAVSVAVTGTAWLAVYALTRMETSPPPLTYRSSDVSSVAPSRIWVEERPRLPRPGSAARSPVRELNEAEIALAELLRRLRDVRGEPAEHVVDEAWQVATDTATSLRSIAVRVEAVELAAEQAPDTLEEALSDLLRQLDEGLDAYRGLIAAAGQVMLADTPVVATAELVEATESLAALAAALRELSTPD
jgi:CheY-like chemotaxis protein